MPEAGPETAAAGRPLVSVVIPVHDMSRYLGDALGSVLAQDYGPIEVIVVDDGSTDASAEVARAFGVDCIRQPRQGVPAARNAGIVRSRGAYVAFQDADDLWAPHKLAVQLRWLQEHPEAGYVAAHFRNFLEPGVVRPWWITAEQLVEPQRGGVPNLVVRRWVFEKIGVFDPGHRSGSDLDWLMRAKDARIAAGILPDILLSRRIHGANQSYQWTGGKRMLLRALKASVERQRAVERELP